MNAQASSRQSNKGGKAPKLVAGICLGLLVLLLVAFLGVNAFVRATYASFFQDAERTLPIPGTDQGFIVQDLDCLEDGTWLFSGYAKDGSTSPVYALTPDGATKRLSLMRPDGTVYDGHGSGITSDTEHVFLTDEEGILIFNVDAFADAHEDSFVHATARKALELAPAFLNIEDNTMYLGNFYHPGAYESPDVHKMDTPGGDWNPAVMYAYPADAQVPYGYAEQASCVYSIPARIQGMCLSSAGQMVLSQSYGLASSHILVYDLSASLGQAFSSAPDAPQTATFDADGRPVPLYFLDALCLQEDITAPPMSEGIEWHDGRVFISCESASDKYLFGKLYGANAVYALNING